MQPMAVLVGAFVQIMCLIVGAAKYGVWGGVLALVAIMATMLQAAALYGTIEPEDEEGTGEDENKDGEQVEQNENVAD